MGNNNSTEEQSQILQFKTIGHPYFKNCKEVRDKNGQYLEIMCALANQQQYANWKMLYEKAPTLQQLMLPVASNYIDNGLCGSNGFAKIKYPNFPYLLHQEIQNRKQNVYRYFDEPQLWYLAYTLFLAAATMHNTDNKVGDIRPCNIFLNTDGEIKVGCVFSWPKQRVNYTKTLSKKQVTYLAPEQIKDLKLGKMNCTTKFQLAQSFSIGLTLLDAVILSQSNQLYIHKLGFDFEGLAKKLFMLKKANYSQVLKILISNLCESSPKYRLQSKQLVKWLKPYQAQIINLQPFQFTDLPDQLLKSYQKLQTMVEKLNIPKIQTKETISSTNVKYPHQNQINQQGRSPIKPQQLQLQEISQNKMDQNYQKSSNKKYQTISKRLDTIQQESSICSQMTSKNSQLDIKDYFRTETVENQKFNLEEIDRQLQRSKRLFPS